MKNEYRIRASGNFYVVIDPLGERLVDDYPTVEAAQSAVERDIEDDSRCETAKLLFDIANRAGQVARIEVDHNNSRLRSP
jgi:hypothetical protein